jgi:hypothetical protein
MADACTTALFDTDSASSRQAFLEVRRVGDRLEFIATSPPRALFSIDGGLGGALASGDAGTFEGLPATRVEIPLAGGERVVLTQGREGKEQTWPLIEASSVEREGRRHLVFVFGDDRARVLYRFDLPPHLGVHGFEAQERRRDPSWTARTVVAFAALIGGAFGDYLEYADETEADAEAVLRRLARLLPSARVDDAIGWRPTPVELGRAEVIQQAFRTWGNELDLQVLTALLAYCELEGRGAALPLRPSPYAISVLLTALRVPFTVLEPDDPSGTLEAAPLLALSSSGVLLLGDGEPEFVSRPEKRTARVAVVRTPVLTRLHENDVRLMIELGMPIYAAWQSDLDRRRRWHLLGRGDDVPSAYAEGHRTWHFLGSVMGEIVDRRQAHPKSPSMLEDHRGSLHFGRPGMPVGDGLKPRDLGMAVPAVDGLPARLVEMAPERLLPGYEALFPEAARLDRMRVALFTAQARTLSSPLDTETLARLRERLDTPGVRNIVNAVVDPGTVDHLAHFLEGAVEIRVPLTHRDALFDKDLAEFAAMGLLYELCTSDQTTVRTFAKSYKATPFRAALRSRLLERIHSGAPGVRASACRLLATSACVSMATERAVVAYELGQRLSDPDPRVVDAAVAGLVGLVLRDEIGAVGLYAIRRLEEPKGAAPEALRRRAVTEVLREMTMNSARLSLSPGGRGPAAPSTAAQSLATFLNDAREACRNAPLEQGRLVLMGAATLEEMLSRLRAYLDLYASEHGCRKEELGELLRKKGVAGLFTFMTRHEVNHARQSPEDEDEVRDVESFRYDRPPLWIESNGKINPAYMALLRRWAEGGGKDLRLARLPIATRTVSRFPTVLYLQLFDPHRRQFVRLIDELTLRSSGVEQQVLTRIATVIPRCGSEPAVASLAVEQPEPTVIPPPCRRELLDLDLLEAGAQERARRVAEAFLLRPEALQAVAYLLDEAKILAPAPTASA